MSEPVKQIECPFCAGDILVKKQGKIFSSVSALVQRCFPLKNFDSFMYERYIKTQEVVSKTNALKGPCKACNGSKLIDDPSDLRNEYKKVENRFKRVAEELTNLEASLGSSSGGGNRCTVIQGNDLLEVGLGINNTPSYSIRGGGRRNKRLVAHGDLNLSDQIVPGAAVFPEGAPCNHIQGINSASSPGGHYTIKCSNKFSLVTGVQGVEITSGGPVIISGGITKIIGPDVTIGSQVGPLTLEGEVVNLVGKSIEVFPHDGDFFVKGTISNTGNLRVAGHTHTESISFVHAECVGKNENTKEAAPSDLCTGPAFYGGGIASEGKILADNDLEVYKKMSEADPMQGNTSARYNLGLEEKKFNILYNEQLWEKNATGYILDGTPITIATSGGNIVGNIVGNVPVHNLPHTHALPDLKHTHTVRIPDIDCSADKANIVRIKQQGVELPVPLHKTTKALRKLEVSVDLRRGSGFGTSMSKLLNSVYKTKQI